MCGIVGYSSSRQDAVPVLLQGLTTLEYRGYDSSGIAVFENNHLEIIDQHLITFNIIEPS